MTTVSTEARSVRFEVVSIACGLLVAAFAFMAIFPFPSWWMEIHRLAVQSPSAPYVAPAIDYERTIHRDFRGSWDLHVWRLEGAEWSAWRDCSGGSRPYRRDAVLPVAPDLEWLANGDRQCWALPPGLYKLTLTIHINPGGFWSRDVQVETEAFEVQRGV